jgi:hypothetical protein
VATNATPGAILPVALSGGRLFTGGGTTIEVYRLTGSFGRRLGPPTSHVSLSGLADFRPRLGFEIAGALPLPVDSLTLKLPKGLSFSGNLTQVKAGVSIAYPGTHKLELRGGSLVATLAGRDAALTPLSVLVRPSALIMSRALHTRTEVLHNFNRTHGHKRRLIEHAVAHVTDGFGGSVNLLLRLVLR